MSTTISLPAPLEIGASRFVSPRFLLRVAGLPIDVVESLSLSETRAWADRVLAFEQRLEDARARLLDVMHEAVHTHAADQPLQRALISLKRDIFNMRPPKDGAKARTASARLAPAGRALVEQWLACVEDYDRLVRGGEETLQREVERQRDELKEVLRDASFRQGLLLSSQTLDRDLDHYLKAPPRDLNRRLRLAERAALLYLFRTACKTSPFSTLGLVTDGYVHEAEPGAPSGAVIYRADEESRRSYVTANINILSRLTTLLLSCAELRGALPVRLKEHWEIHENRIRYLRRIVNPSEFEGPQSMDLVKESIFYLPLSPTLRRLIELLGDDGVMRFEELARRLADGASDDAEKIEEFLTHLMRLDLLVVPALRLPTEGPEVLAFYRRQLAALGHERTDELAARLELVETLVGSYPTASLEERRRLLSLLEREVQDCYALVGGEQAVPRTLLYEDVTIGRERLNLDSETWEGRFASLGDLQDLLPIFDLTVGPRLVMNAFYKVIYGEGQRCDDVLSFAEVFTQDYFEQYRRAQITRAHTDKDGNLLPSINHFNIPEIARLDELKQEFADYMSEELARLAPGSRELVLRRDAVRAIAARIPSQVARLASHAFFSQLAETADGPRLVINRVYSGMTHMFSRFISPLEQQGSHDIRADLAATLERLEPAGAVFAEVQGAYETNLNLHPPVTRYEIVCPGERSARPAAEQIPVSDLYIEHDAQRDVLHLRSKRLDCEVIPLYLGFLLPTALPQLRQVLINFSYPSFASLYLWSGVKGLPEASADVSLMPRIRYGEIVLQRAAWRIPPATFPVRATGQSDSDYFLAVSRWRRTHELPRRVFVAPDSFGQRVRETEAEEKADEARNTDKGREAEADRMSRKPMYVDFENYFSLLLLERLASKSSGGLAFTEMLPDNEQLWLRRHDQSFVTELILELNRTEEPS